MRDALMLLWGGLGGVWIACAAVALVLNARHGFTRPFDIFNATACAPGAAAALLRFPMFTPVIDIDRIASMVAAVEAMPGPHTSVEDNFVRILSSKDLMLYKTGASELIPFIDIYSARRVAVSLYLYDILDAYTTRAKAYALSKGMRIDD